MTNHWWVWSPEFTPSAEACYCYRYIIRESRARKGWLHRTLQQGDRLCPYTGIEAESAICKHGNCECDCERNDCEYCEECEAERVASVEEEGNRSVKGGNLDA